MKKKCLGTILCMIMTVVMLTGCGGNESGGAQKSAGNESVEGAEKTPAQEESGDEAGQLQKSTSEAETAENYTIGYTCPTLNNPFFVGMMEGAQKAADERGVTLTMLGGDNDVTKQVQQVEDFISQGMDAIVIQAVDTTGIVTAVTQANEAGIPVLTTAETPTGGDILCAISFDSYESGFNGGTYIAQTLGEAGKIIELQGVMGQETSREKSRGFAEAIAEYPEMEILASQPADYDRAKAMSVMENMLQTFDDIDAVYAANDEMALGAAQAIEAAGKTGEIFVMGNDGTDEALEAVSQGTLGATNGTPGYIQGYIAVDIAVRHLSGETVPEVINEKNTVIDKTNLEQADQILKVVSEKDWYWLEQF